MRISIIGNYCFTASLPDDLKAVHQYGSESMTAILASQLAKHHQVEFHAPVGSSRIGVYHPTRRTDGKYLPSDLLDDISLDGSKHTDLTNSEFVIDCTPWANNTQSLALYEDYHKYLNYRLGYKDYEHPQHLPRNQRNYITHCTHFAELYRAAGYSAQVAHFGLTDFWSPKTEVDNEYSDYFARMAITNGDYFLFPHRYNPEKGSFDIIRLAQDFPDKTFVFSSAGVSPDHIAYLRQLQNIAPSNCKFIQFPSTPDRDYYRRELYRNAKATLSPFKLMNGYEDTGGILSMESIKCGTPVIVTRSTGSDEIFNHQEDAGAFFIDGYESLKLHIKHTDFLSAKPNHWKWTPELYTQEYITAMTNILA